jgi:O-acetyl-ADP-ribose deacetylase (regulator of RNase III)
MNRPHNRIEIIEGDITQQPVDAIVNAANESLMAGGGVSGAIHRAAGLGLEEECLKLKWCDPGDAKITKGYNLKAKWVIHTVGPVWEGGQYQEAQVLAQCYRNCLALTQTYPIKTIAFPAISTGSYDYPLEAATCIAIQEVTAFLEQHSSPERVVFVCFDRPTYDCYRRLLKG